ncbi:MAG: leucine-rich repeat protein [Ruminococcus flavefaciens]|nr:leucine-rich repeat protein [Ruminococcus flavefaciens]
MKLFKKTICAVIAAGIFISNVFACEGQSMIVNARIYSETANYGDYLEYKKVDVDEDGTYDYIIISDCDKSVTSVDIPDEIDGLPVKEISNNAFYNCSSLTSITIPDSVTIIGYDAFNNTALINNQTDSCVKYADKWAVECDYNYYGGVIIKNGTIGIADGVCSSLSCISIPDSVVFISDGYPKPAYDFAVFGNEGSKAESYAKEHGYKFNSNKAELGKSEYRLNYDDVTKLFFIPDETGEYYFESNCTKSHWLRLDSSGWASQSGLNYFTKTLNADEIYYIELEPYTDSDWNNEYKWAEGDSETVSLGIYKNVTVEKNLSDLEEFTVQSGTKTNIEFTVDEPTSIIVNSNIVDRILSKDDGNYISGDSFYSLEKGTYKLELIGVDEDTVIKIQSLVNNLLKYSGIDEDKDGICDYLVVRECDKSAEEIVIPNEISGLPIKKIGDMTFWNCENLTSIIIPDSVTEIGRMAFQGCKKLKNVNIPENVTTIRAYAFCMCESLEKIDIPESVVSIESYAFFSCHGLKSIDLTSNVKLDCEEYDNGILHNPFGDCGSLTSVNISEANKDYCSVDGVLFNKDKTEIICYPAGKTNSEYILPSSITSIGSDAFRGSKYLQSISVPEDVTSIGNYAFAGCESLSDIYILNPYCKIENSSISNIWKKNKTEFYGTIRGHKNSTAQEYAEKYGYKFEEMQPVIKGDINNDLLVGVSDVVFLQQYIVKSKNISSEQFLAADMNSDGQVNVFDVVILKRRILYQSVF